MAFHIQLIYYRNNRARTKKSVTLPNEWSKYSCVWGGMLTTGGCRGLYDWHTSISSNSERNDHKHSQKEETVAWRDTGIQMTLMRKTESLLEREHLFTSGGEKTRGGRDRWMDKETEGRGQKFSGGEDEWDCVLSTHWKNKQVLRIGWWTRAPGQCVSV